MKKIALLIFSFSISVWAFSQGMIGINTDNPQATLDIRPFNPSDPTKVDGILMPSISMADLQNKNAYTTQQKGVMVYVKDVNAVKARTEITKKITEDGFHVFNGNVWEPLSSTGATVPKSAPLTDNKDITTIPNPVQGMVVYNTKASSSLEVGMVYFNGTTWLKMLTEAPKNSANILNLASNVSTTQCTSVTIDQGAPLSFKESGNIVNSIVLPVDGSFAFTFRLYGLVQGVNLSNFTSGVGIYYMGLFVNDIIADAAEIDAVLTPLPASGNVVLTYSITLTCSANAGDRVSFKLGHYYVTPYPWTLRADSNNTNAARTSMVWWKL